MAKNKTNPRKQPRTEEDCRRAWRVGCIDGLRLMEAILLRVLIDKHEGEIDVNALWNELVDYTQAWADGRVTAADLRETLRREDKVLLLSGPSKAIAHGRGGRVMIELKENELYQEIGIYLGETQIGEMEVDLKGKMLSRLIVYEPYQNNGYGQEIVKLAKEQYGCNCLWVRADNAKAIHVYEKLGFIKQNPTMYLMEIPTIISAEEDE